MDGPMLSAAAALGGSLIGALTSFATTWLAQTHQRRVQRELQEITRRERLFGDFIMQASELYADALTHNRIEAPKLVSLYAVKAQVCAICITGDDRMRRRSPSTDHRYLLSAEPRFEQPRAGFE